MKRLGMLAFAIVIFLPAALLASEAKQTEDEVEAGQPVTDEKLARQKEEREKLAKQIQDIKDNYLTSRKGKDLRTGERKILAIHDPRAVMPLVNVLYDKSVARRAILIKALSGFSERGNRQAQVALQELAVVEGRVALRKKIIEALKKIEKGNRSDRLLRHLQDDAVPAARDRAAYALAEMGEKRAIRYLINALITEETRKVSATYLDDTTFTFTYSPYGQAERGRWIVPGVLYSFPVEVRGGLYHIPYSRLLNPATTLSLGTQHRRKLEKPVETIVKVKHPRVLAALKKLTKRNFGYDEIAWRQWVKNNPDQLPPWQPIIDAVD